MSAPVSARRQASRGSEPASELFLGPGRGEALVAGPLADVASLDGRGHEVGEPVGGAGEAGDAEAGEGGGVGFVEAGRAVVVQGQERLYASIRRKRRTNTRPGTWTSGWPRWT